MRASWYIGLLLFVWASALCAQPSTLYQAQIMVVAPQNQQETLAALREAFLTVVVRVSGEPAARDSAYLVKKAENVEDYVDRYSYQTINAVLTDADDQSQPMPTKRLTVDFSPRLIDQLLGQAKIHGWESDRPLILVLVKDEDGGFVSTTRATQLSTQIQNEFYRHGVLFMLPEMDTDDVLILGDTFITPSQDQWMLLSRRYHYQSVLMGELTQNNKEGVVTWVAQWQLMLNNQVIPIKAEGGDQQVVMARTADNVISTLKSALKSAALKETKTRQWIVHVRDIDNDENYKTARDYFEKLPSVNMVKFIKLNGNTVTYQVTGDANLEKTIAAELTLIPDVEHTNTAAELYYSLNRVP